MTPDQLAAVVDEFRDDGSALHAYTAVLVSARGRRQPSHSEGDGRAT